MKNKYFPKIMCCLLLADDKLRPFVGNARAVTGRGVRKLPRMFIILLLGIINSLCDVKCEGQTSSIIELSV